VPTSCGSKELSMELYHYYQSPPLFEGLTIMMRRSKAGINKKTVSQIILQLRVIHTEVIRTVTLKSILMNELRVLVKYDDSEHKTSIHEGAERLTDGLVNIGHEI
jgi:hypothetical protein